MSATLEVDGIIFSGKTSVAEETANRNDGCVFCKIKVQKIAKENTQACQPSNQYLFLT